MLSSREQPPLFTCKAHIFQVDPDTRKTWIPLSSGAGMFIGVNVDEHYFHWDILVNVQIFHDSVKNVYRILSVDGSKVMINTIVTARMSFTKTSQKFCQWVDARANHVYGLGFSNEGDLIRVNRIEKKLVRRNLFLVYGKIHRSEGCHTSSSEK